MSEGGLTIRRAYRVLLDSSPTGTKFKLLLFLIGSFILALFDLVSVLLLGLATSALLQNSSSFENQSKIPFFGSAVTSITPSTIVLIAILVLVIKSFCNLTLVSRLERFIRVKEKRIAVATFRKMNGVRLDELEVLDPTRVLTGVSWWAEGISGAVLASLFFLSDIAVSGVIATGLLLVVFDSAVVAVGGLAIFFLITQKPISIASRRAAHSVRNAYAQILLVIDSSLKLRRETRIYQISSWFENKFSSAYEEVIDNSVKFALINRLPILIYEPVMLLLLLAAGAMAFARHTPAEATGILVVLTFGIAKVIASITKAQNSVLAMNKMLGEANSAESVVAGLNSINLNPSTTYLSPFESRPSQGVAPRLFLTDVSYRYPSSELDSISKVTLQVDGGMRIALVGATGAGKSTLVDLVLGLLKPTSGKVMWTDDVGTATYPRIGYVPQDVVILPGSILENVAIGEDESLVNRERVRFALELADALQFAIGSPNGLNTTIGSGNSGLSGGEKQRLGIARALYRQPNVLVLDEVTSSLDGASENKIADSLKKLHGQVTVILVAHRMATVRDADLVLYLSDGRIIDQGTFVEVVERNPDFARQVALQE